MYEGNVCRGMRTHTKKRSLELIEFVSLYTQHEYFQMRKSSASDGDGDKNICSKISCGCYFTIDEEVALTKYLVHLPINNDAIMDMDME